MKYKINIATNGVSVDRISNARARLPYLVSSLVCLFISAGGGYSVYSTGLDQLESSVPVIAFLAGGLICLVTFVYAMVVGTFMQRLPERIIFNNDRAMVEIHHHASAVGQIEIPYHDVSEIEPRAITYWDSQSKKMKSRYAVSMCLHDGTTWDLLEDSMLDLSYASDYSAEIKNHVKLNSAFSNQSATPDVRKNNFSVLTRGEETQIRWRNNYPARAGWKVFRIVLLLGVTVFISALIATNSGIDLIAVSQTIFSMENPSQVLTMTDKIGLPLTIAFGVGVTLVILLLLQVVAIVRFRMKENEITINRSAINSQSLRLDIPILQVATASFSYYISEGVQDLKILKDLPIQSKATSFQKGDTDFDDVSGMIKNTFKVFSREAINQTLRKQELEDLPEVLGTIPLDKFSPVDAYAIKERIMKMVKSVNLGATEN